MEDCKFQLLQKKTAASIFLATALHPHTSDYSLESCSSAELSSAWSDTNKINKNTVIKQM